MNIDRNVLKNTKIEDLRQRITLQEASETRDTEGNILTSYSNRMTVWACVNTFSASIITGEYESDSVISYQVIIRYGIYILQTDRILWNGHILRIVSPPVDAGGRHAWTVLECKEWVET